jgi:hypothetical protein
MAGSYYIMYIYYIFFANLLVDSISQISFKVPQKWNAAISYLFEMMISFILDIYTQRKDS